MKNGTWILTICLAATAWAQNPARSSTPTTGAPGIPKVQATSTPKQAAPKPQPASQPSAAKPNPPLPAKTAAATPKKPGVAEKKPAAATPGKQAQAANKVSAGKPVAKKVSVRQGRRDPFVSPIAERKTAVCTGIGKRCLYIGDLNLVGIVESSNGVIAVVASGRRTYFLRENDPLADGEVTRISSDAITLRQRTSDLMGKPVVREVTRKIGMPAV